MALLIVEWRNKGKGALSKTLLLHFLIFNNLRLVVIDLERVRVGGSIGSSTIVRDIVAPPPCVMGLTLLCGILVSKLQ